MVVGQGKLPTFREFESHFSQFGNPVLWALSLGRVDGFDQDESSGEGDERAEVSFGFLAA